MLYSSKNPKCGSCVFLAKQFGNCSCNGECRANKSQLESQLFILKCTFGMFLREGRDMEILVWSIKKTQKLLLVIDLLQLFQKIEK